MHIVGQPCGRVSRKKTRECGRARTPCSRRTGARLTGPLLSRTPPGQATAAHILRAAGLPYLGEFWSPCRKSDTQRLNVTQPSPRSLHPVHVDGRLTPHAVSDIVAATIGVHTVNVYFCRSSPVRRSSKLQHRHSSRIQRAGVRCPSHQVQRPPDSRKVLNPLIIYAGRSDRSV